MKKKEPVIEMVSNYRSKFDTYLDILQTLYTAKNNTLPITKLLYKVNMSYPRLKQMLDNLEIHGLVKQLPTNEKKRRRAYTLNKEGIETVICYQKLKKNLKFCYKEKELRKKIIPYEESFLQRMLRVEKLRKEIEERNKGEK